MYVNKKEHYLSRSLYLSAAIHIFSNLIMAVIRKVSQGANPNGPDMANQMVLLGQIIVSTIQVIMIAIVFVGAYEHLRKALSVVEESDRLRMAVLQQEIMGSKVPTLTGDDICKLMELWGVILIAVRMVYDICSMVYRRFVMDLLDLGVTSESSNESFVTIYNNTHGFKYIGLLVAILIGVMMTGIFLNDRLLKVISMILMTFFIFSFVILGMRTVTIGGYSVGIVWTSVIFHLVETVGLFVLGFYLRKKYIGL
ncbi:hypothetical protein [Butyrivibrio sp. YAB3001]|uniref:hypothetical protein n=1 Tax=Butyrivibrio sp. YAB3001 TaxID=1520812 RepID=UPI0008F68BA7|nr:hypothetical protein [Butyrivibrio sp. YAB3001]SFC22679.1 hypothetical protein SAMN02910398_01804 [Butyrivibrio sp. YAB3001]